MKRVALAVMMNAARIGVGMQGLGLTEVAYQNAAAYAKDRLQMRSLSGVKATDKPADPIIVHPDVRKMLLTARAYAEGGRALAMWTTLQIDKELGTLEPGKWADFVVLNASPLENISNVRKQHSVWIGGKRVGGQ